MARIGRRELTPAYLDPDQKAALDELSKRKGRPRQEFLREGIDLVLKKYRQPKNPRRPKQ